MLSAVLRRPTGALGVPRPASWLGQQPYNPLILMIGLIGGRASATRLVAAYLLFSVGLMFLPKPDIPETSFDEANTPTNEMIVEKAPAPLVPVLVLIGGSFAHATSICCILSCSAVHMIHPNNVWQILCVLIC